MPVEIPPPEPADLVRLIESMATYTRLEPREIARKACGDSDAYRRLQAGRRVGRQRRERILSWLSGHWPARLHWPAAIGRPAADRLDPVLGGLDRGGPGASGTPGTRWRADGNACRPSPRGAASIAGTPGRRSIACWRRDSSGGRRTTWERIDG